MKIKKELILLEFITITMPFVVHNCIDKLIIDIKKFKCEKIFKK